MVELDDMDGGRGAGERGKTREKEKGEAPGEGRREGGARPDKRVITHVRLPELIIGRPARPPPRRHAALPIRKRAERERTLTWGVLSTEDGVCALHAGLAGRRRRRGGGRKASGGLDGPHSYLRATPLRSHGPPSMCAPLSAPCAPGPRPAPHRPDPAAHRALARVGGTHRLPREGPPGRPAGGRCTRAPQEAGHA